MRKILSYGFRILTLNFKKGEWLDDNFPHGGQNKGLRQSEVPRLDLAMMPVTKKDSAMARMT